MKSPRRLLALVLVAGLVASARIVPATTPHAAPAFRLPCARDTVSSDSLRGSVVLVDFWASWCAPCARSFPWLESLHQRYSSRGLRVVAINLDKDPMLRDRFLEQHAVTFRVAYDPKGHTASAYKVSVMPTSVLIGRDGTILEVHAGFDPRTADAFEHRITEALAR